MTASTQKFQNTARLMIYYTILVILWGAWVRISHSGDGCGDTWPLCQGQILPEDGRGKTWVELSHRLTSGLFGIFVVILFFWGRKIYGKNHPARKWLTLSLVFTITEALLGAKLVLFKLVGTNDSPFRLSAMSLHLLNSLLLVLSLTMLWDFSKGQSWVKRLSSPLTTLSLSFSKLSWSFLFIFLVIAISGAWAALSTTLFPTTSLFQGWETDFSPDSHYLLKLRGFHPLFGMLLGGGMTLGFWLLMQLIQPNETVLRDRTRRVAVILGVGVLFGLATLLSLSPLWMKIGHLTLAHTIWIQLILWAQALRYQKIS